MLYEYLIVAGSSHLGGWKTLLVLKVVEKAAKAAAK